MQIVIMTAAMAVFVIALYVVLKAADEDSRENTRQFIKEYGQKISDDLCAMDTQMDRLERLRDEVRALKAEIEAMRGKAE